MLGSSSGSYCGGGVATVASYLSFQAPWVAEYSFYIDEVQGAWEICKPLSNPLKNPSVGLLQLSSTSPSHTCSKMWSKRDPLLSHLILELLASLRHLVRVSI